MAMCLTGYTSYSDWLAAFCKPPLLMIIELMPRHSEKGLA